MKPKELIRRLEQEGWQIVRTEGSHHMMKHPDSKHLIVVPFHNTDLKPGILNKILKQAGLK